MHEQPDSSCTGSTKQIITLSSTCHTDTRYQPGSGTTTRGVYPAHGVPYVYQYDKPRTGRATLFHETNNKRKEIYASLGWCFCFFEHKEKESVAIDILVSLRDSKSRVLIIGTSLVISASENHMRS